MLLKEEQYPVHEMLEPTKIDGMKNIWYDHACWGGAFHMPEEVWAPGPGNLPAVQFLAGGSVGFGSRPSQKPKPLCLGGLYTQIGHKPPGFWPGWNQTVVTTLRFLHVSLQLSIWVLIVLWHDQCVQCAVLAALWPPAFRSAIWLIFVEWVWKKLKFHAKLAGFRLGLNKYRSDHTSEIGRWKSS